MNVATSASPTAPAIPKLSAAQFLLLSYILQQGGIDSERLWIAASGSTRLWSRSLSFTTSLRILARVRALGLVEEVTGEAGKKTFVSFRGIEAVNAEQGRRDYATIIREEAKAAR